MPAGRQTGHGRLVHPRAGHRYPFWPENFSMSFVWDQTTEINATRELYREYRDTLTSRRVSLRNVVIELVDSETFWGRWFHETRTIQMSRKLISQYPWFQVVAILKHEMAHQYVDEMMIGVRDRETAHGASFRAACEILGVPSEFSGASVNLSEHTLDWRAEKRDDVTEKMLDRVRKLLALATSTNEHEAALAMNRVREIYAKYNIEHAPAQEFVHLVISTGSQRMEIFEKKIAGILIGHFFVEVILGHQYDAKSSQHHRTLILIGRRENVLMAEYVYHFLREQSLSLVRTVPGARMDRVTKKSFRLGILEGFREKLAAAETAPAAGATVGAPAEANPISRALVTFKKDRELKNYIAKIYPRLRSSSSGSQQMDRSAYAAGKQAGGKITLNKPVSGRGLNMGRVLGGR
jgi:hypothetical protein